MPKVSAEYLANKRQDIADAAYRVCLRKPVSSVTMTDIINETGLSQGGIYRFYTDLDDILRTMIANMRKEYGIIEDTDEIFASCEELSIEEFSRKICDMLADRMEKMLTTVLKINYDISVLAINEPKRVEKILEGVEPESNMEHLTMATVELVTGKIKSGEIKPRMEPVQLMQFITCAYAGIERNCIISNCYDSGPMKVKYEPKPMFDALAETIAHLMGA